MPRWKRSDKLTEETALGRGSMYSPQLILQTLRQRMWTIMLVALVTTGAAIAVPTTPVAEAVVERLEAPPEGGAGEVLANSSAEPDPGTVFVNVSYKDSDPKRAQLIANTIGIVLSKKIPEMTLGANAITATVWEPATLPETPLSPDPIRNGIIGLMLGSLLGLVLAFLLEHVSDRWKSRDELEEDFGVPTLGVVPKFRVSARRKETLVSKEGER